MDSILELLEASDSLKRFRLYPGLEKYIKIGLKLENDDWVITKIEHNKEEKSDIVTFEKLPLETKLDINSNNINIIDNKHTNGCIEHIVCTPIIEEENKPIISTEIPDIEKLKDKVRIIQNCNKKAYEFMNRCNLLFYGYIHEQTTKLDLFPKDIEKCMYHFFYQPELPIYMGKVSCEDDDCYSKRIYFFADEWFPAQKSVYISFPSLYENAETEETTDINKRFVMYPAQFEFNFNNLLFIDICIDKEFWENSIRGSLEIDFQCERNGSDSEMDDYFENENEYENESDGWKSIGKIFISKSQYAVVYDCCALEWETNDALLAMDILLHEMNRVRSFTSYRSSRRILESLHLSPTKHIYAELWTQQFTQPSILINIFKLQLIKKVNPKLLPDMTVEEAFWITSGCVHDIITICGDKSCAIGIAIFNSFINDMRSILHAVAHVITTHEHRVQLYPIYHWFKHWGNIKIMKREMKKNSKSKEKYDNNLEPGELLNLEFDKLEETWINANLAKIVKMDARIGQYSERLLPLELAVRESTCRERLLQVISQSS